MSDTDTRKLTATVTLVLRDLPAFRLQVTDSDGEERTTELDASQAGWLHALTGPEVAPTVYRDLTEALSQWEATAS